ncbi:Chaperone of endosialidase [uncultured archaeon]|nr:Chaperone of endosialidase [uncultured archaeon]
MVDISKVKAGNLITSDLIIDMATDIQKAVKFDNNGNVGIGTTAPRAKLDVKGEIGLSAPDAGIYGISLQRTDEQVRMHQWKFWHMNSSYRKNSLEIWEYKADSHGNTCGGDGNDGAMCDPRIVILEGGNVGIGTTSPSEKLTIQGDASAPVALNVGGTSNAKIRVRHIDGKDHQSRNLDNLYLQYGINNHTILNAGGSTGNVGIGTTEPRAKLDVKGEIGLSAPDFCIYCISLQITDEQYRMHQWKFWHMNSSYRKNSLEIWEYKADSHGLTCDGDLNDGAMCAPRIVIQEGGSVGIGTTTPTTKLHVAGGWVRVGNNADESIQLETQGTFHRIAFNELRFWDWHSGYDIVTFKDGNAYKPGGGAWGVLSDIRLKKNLQPLKGTLDLLLKLRGISFEWKEPEKQGNLTGKQIGLIADEVKDVFPDWVGIGSDGFKTLSIRGFEALTIEAFRDLNAEIEELKSKNNEFENRIKALEKKTKPK